MKPDYSSFARLMNAKAAKLGLHDTHFVRPDGLDVPDHYSSAYDLAQLARRGMREDVFREIVAAPEVRSEGIVLVGHNPLIGVYPGADFEVLPYAFVVVIVGGLGSLPGAMVGSLLVGLLDNFGKALFPELSYFTLFAPMALILALRPTGLFGRS